MAGPVLELLKAADWPTWPTPTYLSMLIPADPGPAWPGLSQHLIFLPQPELWQQLPHLHIVAPPNSLCQLCWDRRDSCTPPDGRASAGAAEGSRLANLADTDVSLDVDPGGSGTCMAWPLSAPHLSAPTRTLAAVPPSLHSRPAEFSLPTLLGQKRFLYASRWPGQCWTCRRHQIGQLGRHRHISRC